MDNTRGHFTQVRENTKLVKYPRILPSRTPNKMKISYIKRQREDDFYPFFSCLGMWGGGGVGGGGGFFLGSNVKYSRVSGVFT